jgi:Tfp pilus assembly protein PilZ
VDTNYDQRGDKRFKYEAAIWHENILPGRFYRAKICNISRNGLYFESDQTLYQGEKIYIGSKNPETTKNIADECAGVQIMWRRDLEASSYRYGYGAEFLEPDNPLVKSIDNTRIVSQHSRGTSGRYRKDPREHMREPYRKEIVFTTKNHSYKGTIVNISRGGAFVTTKNKFSLGQMIQLDIREDKTCKALRLKGWVVRLSPTGIGVKFDRRIRHDRRKRLDRRVRRQSDRRKFRDSH